MIFIRAFWFLTGVGVMLQYGWWAALEIAYGLGWHAPPVVTHDWLFLAFAGAFIFCGDRLGPELKKLISDVASPDERQKR